MNENSIEDATIVSEESNQPTMLDRLNEESDALEINIDKLRDAVCNGSIPKYAQQINGEQLTAMLTYQRCLKTKIDTLEYIDTLTK